MQPLPHTRSCFCCGLNNPIGFKLDLVGDPQTVETRFQFRSEHCGFPGVIHGGLITTILDEVMAWVIGVNTRQFAYCAELTVRFVRTVAPEMDVVARGDLLENKRGKLFLVRAQLLSSSGDLLAEANGKFLPLPEKGQKAMRSEFIEDPTAILGPPP